MIRERARRIKRKIEKFIKKQWLRVRIATGSFRKNHLSWDVLQRLTWYLVEVSVTGLLAYYALTHFNWASVGIAIALMTYYLQTFITLIKAPYEELKR